MKNQEAERVEAESCRLHMFRPVWVLIVAIGRVWGRGMAVAEVGEAHKGQVLVSKATRPPPPSLLRRMGVVSAEIQEFSGGM